MDSTFGGLAKVSKEEVIECVYNTICFIERIRNAYFKEQVDYYMNTITWKRALICDCFIRYIMNGRKITREIAKELVWSGYFDYNVFDQYYKYANSLIGLARASTEDYVYITDQFADIILIGKTVNPGNTAGKTATELNDMIQFI